MMNNNIKGKVFVITGASSGLGEATARLFSARVRLLCGAHDVWIAFSRWQTS
jgi:NADP-dependent 3-hydroxy acid dehydrogenase YdfG